MPINQRNADNRDGFKCIPWTVINKAASSTPIYTPFAYIYMAIHVNATTGGVVATSAVAGTAAAALTVANAGNLLVWGNGDGAATVTLS